MHFMCRPTERSIFTVARCVTNQAGLFDTQSEGLVPDWKVKCQKGWKQKNTVGLGPTELERVNTRPKQTNKQTNKTKQLPGHKF